MSTFASIIGKDFIKILTDGAVYTPDGTLAEVRRKIWTSEVIPMAVTGRGIMLATEHFATACIHYAGATLSFDKTIQRMQEGLDKGGMRKSNGEEVKSHFELLIAGLSETEGFVNYLCTSIDGRAGLSEWKLESAGDVVVAGPIFDISNEEWLASGIDLGRKKEAQFWDAHGADIIEMMRKKKGQNPADPTAPELYGIGGQCDLTTITAEGANTRTLRVWADPIGEKINPFRERANNIVHLITRQQRRAAERLAKKRA